MEMTVKQKKKACTEFIDKLATRLNGSYEMIGSCNKDFSKYLVPVGTADQISYYGKPENSFRISDHWNWYSNLKKCADPTYVQCKSLDIPWARKRSEEGKASEPRFGVQVAIQLADGCYHHVFGDKFDRKTKTWCWEEWSIEDVINKYILKGE